MPDIYQLELTRARYPKYRIVIQFRYNDGEHSIFARPVHYHRFDGKNALEEAKTFIRDRNLIEQLQL